MKAVRYNKKATPRKMEYTDVEKPIPTDDEVLVKIVAVSINAADYRSIKMGMIPKKKIFGADIAGRVEAVGKNIKGFKPGDEVFGDLASYGFGGFAEYVAVPEKALARKPGEITFEAAAALPIAALTALQALRDKGKIQEGQKVLIVGSGGGVGTFAVQLARYFGADVSAVCSTKNTEQAKALGASTVIDYTREDFTNTSERYNLILAVNGNRPLTAYRRILARNGIYVMVGGGLPQIFGTILFGWLFSLGTKKMRFLTAKANSKDLEYLAQLVAQKHISPVIEKQYPLAETPEAMEYVSQGHARGKVVINV